MSDREMEEWRAMFNGASRCKHGVLTNQQQCWDCKAEHERSELDRLRKENAALREENATLQGLAILYLGWLNHPNPRECLGTDLHDPEMAVEARAALQGAKDD